MKNGTVLVTGWGGYLGPVVVRHLREAGHYVIGLDTGWFLPQYAAVPAYPDEAFYGDLRDKRLTDWLGGLRVKDFLGPTAIVHLAGLSNDPLGQMDGALTRAINVEGTLNLIGAAKYTRHVIVSSCSVYGTAEMATEDRPTQPLTAYALAKDLVDMEAPSLAENAVSLRLGTVYGWSPGHRLDLVVNRMVYDATHGLGITVNGNAARPLVHVEDVARAIVFMLDRPETGIYNVVGENWRMAALADEVAHRVHEATGKRPRVKTVPADADQRDYAADGSKLRTLGLNFENSVTHTIPDLAAKSLALGGPRSRYERLSAIRNLISSGALTPDLRRKESIAA